MIKKYFILYLAITLVFLSGCLSEKIAVKNQEPNINEARIFYISNNSKNFEEQATIKNYKINDIQTSYVGESFINSKDILNMVETFDIFKPTQNFNILDPINASFVQDDTFLVQGSYSINNKKYLVVNNYALKSYYQLLLDDKNNVAGLLKFSRSLNATDPVYIIDKNIPYEPKEIKFQKNVYRKETKIKDGMRYELIYTGCTADNLTMVYREYTPDDLARPAFFQNLTYNIKQKQIRFKNLLIEIMLADNEKIVFKVLKD